jgi:hypothetical protein
MMGPPASVDEPRCRPRTTERDSDPGLQQTVRDPTGMVITQRGGEDPRLKVRRGGSAGVLAAGPSATRTTASSTDTVVYGHNGGG